MSDVYTPPAPNTDGSIEPRQDEPSVEAEPQWSHKCPECGKLFATLQALGSHRYGAHNVPGVHRPSYKRLTCPQCGKRVHQNSLARHIQAIHGAVEDQPKRRGRPPKAEPKAEPKVMIDADDLLVTVVQIAFPDGQVPVDKFEALLRWREQTRELLHTLVSS